MDNDSIKILIHCVVNILYTLEVASDDDINPDFAIKISEDSCYQISHVNKKDLNALLAVISKMGEDESDPQKKLFLDDFDDISGLAALSK